MFENKSVNNIINKIKEIRIRDKFRMSKSYNLFWGKVIYIKNKIFNKYDLYVVGMPKSGSEFFYHVIYDIIKKIDENVRIINIVGGGKQHLIYDKTIGLNKRRQVFGIYRDLRDVVVSAYFYAIGQGKIHHLHNSVKDLEFNEAIDKLIVHEKSMLRYNKWFLDYYNKKYVSLVKFEDITSENNVMIFTNLFRNIGIDVPSKIIEESLEKNSFNKLKKKDPVHYKDGKKEKYKKYLSEKQINKITKKFHKYFELTGYKI